MVRRTKVLKKRYWRIANNMVFKYDKFNNILGELYKTIGISTIPMDDDKVLKELKFMGWVNINDYKLKPKYGYFITNRPLGKHKEVLIYPKGFSDSIQTKRDCDKGKTEYYTKALNLGLHGGIPGYIKYKYSKYIW